MCIYLDVRQYREMLATNSVSDWEEKQEQSRWKAGFPARAKFGAWGFFTRATFEEKFDYEIANGEITRGVQKAFYAAIELENQKLDAFLAHAAGELAIARAIESTPRVKVK